MLSLLSRYPVLVDSRVLSLVTAVAVAVAALPLGPDGVEAGKSAGRLIITGDR